MQNLKGQHAAPIYEQIPPNNKEAEMQLIAAICQAPDVAPEICNTLTARDFYDANNAAIFGAITQAVKSGTVADVHAITAQCLQNGNEESAQVLSAYMAAQTNGSTFASLNAARFAEAVKDCAIRRRALELLNKYAKEFADMTSDTTATTAEMLQQLCDIQTTEANAPTSFDDAISKMVARIDANRNGQSLNVATLDAIDKHTGGFQFGELEIVGAESGTGKTAFALSIAKRAAMVTGTPLLYFSSEMESDKLCARLLSADARIPAGDIIARPLDNYAANSVYNAVDELREKIGNRVFFEDKNKNGLSQIVASIRRAVARYGVKLVFVDYLQQFVSNGSTNETKEQATANFARELKNTAQELQICVVLLSQLRKGVDVMERPTLLRLRDSGQIAEAADNVLIIDRPEARPETSARKYAAPWAKYTTHETAVVTLEKCRNAAPRSFLFGWSGEYVAFYDIDPETKKEDARNTGKDIFGV